MRYLRVITDYEHIPTHPARAFDQDATEYTAADKLPISSFQIWPCDWDEDDGPPQARK